VLDFSNLGEEFFLPIETQPLSNPFLIHKNQAPSWAQGLEVSRSS